MVSDGFHQTSHLYSYKSWADSCSLSLFGRAYYAVFHGRWYFEKQSIYLQAAISQVRLFWFKCSKSGRIYFAWAQIGAFSHFLAPNTTGNFRCWPRLKSLFEHGWVRRAVPTCSAIPEGPCSPVRLGAAIGAVWSASASLRLCPFLSASEPPVMPKVSRRDSRIDSHNKQGHISVLPVQH